VIELVVLAALAFAALIVIGILISVFSVVGWFLWLPFRILGWVLRLVGLVFAAPFVLIACLLGGLGTLLGFGAVVLPVLPLALAGWVVWWLLRPQRAQHAKTS
jgi:hypothetical protein